MPDTRPIVRPVTAVVLSAIILMLCIGSGVFSLPYLASAADQPTKAANTSGTPVARPTPNLIESVSAKVGQPAIDFALLNLTGQQIFLSDFRGKVVIVTFWATWCPPCRTEIPELNNVYLDLKGEGVEVLAIDVRESHDVVNEFVQDMGMNYPVLLDSRGHLAYAYGVRGIPTSFFIDRQGILREMRVGGVTEEMIRSILESIDS